MVIHAAEADTSRVFAGECMWAEVINQQPRVSSARKELRRQSQSGDRQERDSRGSERRAVFDPGLRAWPYLEAAAIPLHCPSQQAASGSQAKAAAPRPAAPRRRICLVDSERSAFELIGLVSLCAADHMPSTYYAVLLGLKAGME